MMLIDALDIEAESDAEVFFVSEEDVDQRDELAVHGTRFVGAADSLPKRRAIVQVVGHDRAAAPRRLHRFTCDEWSRLRQRRENAAGVKPPYPAGEKTLPIDLAGLHLRDGRVPSIRTSEGSADAKTAFGEVEAVARAPSDTVIVNPPQPGEIATALQHEIFDEAADRIVDESGDDRGAQAEAAAKSARDVVLSAAFPRLKSSRGRNASFAWVEPK